MERTVTPYSTPYRLRGLLMAEPLSTLAAFTNRPECRKCGGDRFSWEYRETVQTGPARTMGDPACPHLRLACQRCDWGFNMQPKDAK